MLTWSAVTGGQSPPSEPVLDLNGYRASQATPAHPLSALLEKAMGDPSPSTLRLTLTTPRLTLTATQIMRAENPLVLYSVLIENVGLEDIVVPWAADLNEIGPEQPIELAGRIALWIDAPGGGRFVAEHMLYGATPVMGSTLRLKPGDRARIRASGSWNLPEVGRGQTVRLAAKLYLFDMGRGLGVATSQVVLLRPQ